MIKQTLLTLFEETLDTMTTQYKEIGINKYNKERSMPYRVRCIGDYYRVETYTGRIVADELIDKDFVKMVLVHLGHGDITKVNEVLSLERQYQKHVSDMCYFVSAYKRTLDPFYKQVVKDRFEMSKQNATLLKLKIKDTRLLC